MLKIATKAADTETTVVNHVEKFYELVTIKTLEQTTVVSNVPRNCGTIEI